MTIREGAEWNTDALGPTKRRYATSSCAGSARRFAPGGAPARRAGQVVPGRAAAALGAVLLLPQGRRAGLARSSAVRARAEAGDDTERGRRTRSSRRSPRRSGVEREARASRVRGRLVLPLARAPAAGQRRSVRGQARRRARAGAPGARVRAGPRRGRRLRAAAARVPRRRSAARGRAAVVRATRAALPLPGDSPMGFGCRSTACPGSSDGGSAPLRARSSTRRRSARRRDPTRAVRRGDDGTAPAVRPDVAASPRRTDPAAPRRFESDPSCRPHRPLRRAARRHAARLHAAARDGSRTTSSCARPSRTPPRARGKRVRIEGYHPPVGPAPRPLAGHARSRRHRGEHPPDAQLERAGRRARPILYEEARQRRLARREVHARRAPHRHRRRQPRRARRADAGRQPVPAPPRSAAQPASATGSTTRRCRTCSPGCSSGRPARRRASTRRATTASTSSSIAFARSRPERGGHVPPWLVDRLFRHLLVDVTGNTHRTEICIDKLYSPDSAAGRQGLVELRAFEMPPHARMSLTQQLLRARAGRLVLAERRTASRRCAGAPSSHDRFTLPHFVRQDFDDVLDDLRARGLPVRARLVRAPPRVPLSALGHASSRAAASSLELRQAIEPWHVLGEEAGAGGTARYVDSSVERVEVKVRGMIDERHVVAVQRPARAAAPDGHARRGRGRRALPRLAAAVGAAPDHRRARAAGLRRHRPLERPRHRRLHLPRGAPGRALARDVSAQRPRGRGPPRRALLPLRPHAGQAAPAAIEHNRQFPFTLDLRM